MDMQPDSSARTVAIDLCGRIVDGQFLAGQRITEREVVALYGVSAAMSREVFYILEKAGAISLSARRGARVVDARRAPPDHVKETWNLLADFLLLEVRRVTGSAPPSGRRVADTARPALRMGSIERRIQHLADLAHNRRAAELMSKTVLQLAIVAPERLVRAEARLCP